jgi:hypothetical protein
MGKIVVGHFLCGRPSAAVPPGLISHASGPLSFPVPPSLIDGTHMPVLSSPKSPSSACPCGNTVQIAGDGAATRHHPSVVRMPTCAPAALSRRASCCASWHPVTAAACVYPRRLCAGRIPEPTTRR